MKVLLILGGESPPLDLLEKQVKCSEKVIAVDGGIQPLFEIGLQADLLVGDFDSVKNKPFSYNCSEVLHMPQQNRSDFQKALDQVPVATDAITILGGTGKRLDHFINNLLIAMAVDLPKAVCFMDGSCSIYRITPHRPLLLNGVANNQFSLLPFTIAKGVQTEGLRWNLKSQNMSPLEQLGISNIALSDKIRISILEGCLWVIDNKTKF